MYIFFDESDLNEIYRWEILYRFVFSIVYKFYLKSFEK